MITLVAIPRFGVFVLAHIMSHVHYKFQSNNEHDSIVFDGLGISLAELRSSILAKSKLAQSADFNIQITNAQTKEGEFS